MDQRWMLSEDGGVSYTREVFPVGPNTWTRERDLAAGQIFFRRKLSKALLFKGDDYTYFRGLEKRSSRRCTELFIRREWLCGTGWKVFWTGTFSTGAGSFDLDLCQFTVKPEVFDRYSCLLKNQNKKINILQAGPKVTANVVILPSLEWGACTFTEGHAEPLGGCSEFVDNDFNPVNSWLLANDQFYDNGTDSFTLYTFWRERQSTPCIGGNPVPPPGIGWVLLEDNCDLDGSATYVRPPTISYTFGDAVAGTWDEDNNPIQPDDSCLWVFIGEGGLVDELTGLEIMPWFVCLTAGEPIQYQNARTGLDCLTFIASSIGCELNGIVSDFLEWDPAGDAVGYAAGFNYVTGRANQVDHLLLTQKSDAIDPNASSPATIGEMTFKEFMSMLLSMRLFWDIDDNGTLRIEHWSYWTFPVGLDLAAYQAIQRRAYEHLSNEIPRYERMKWMEAQGKDFIGVDIVYSGPCINVEDRSEVKEYAIGRITTDVPFVNGDPDTISKDGFVLLVTSYNGTSYDVILDSGALSGNVVTNAPLSTANLERDFWTWDRFMPTGNLNGQDMTFDGFQPNIQQRPVTITNFCCELLKFDPKKSVQGELGAALGDLLGHVQKEEFEDQRMTTTLTLRYPY